MLRKTLLTCLTFVCLAALSQAKPKSQSNVPCKAYFGIVENDASTSNLSESGMNKPQAKWWKKNAKKYLGICYIGATDKDPDSPEGIPLYGIVWEEHLVNRLNEGTTDRDYVASGTLFIWVPPNKTQKGRLVPVAALHNANQTIFTSVSVSLLKDALAFMQGKKSERPILTSPDDPSPKQ